MMGEDIKAERCYQNYAFVKGVGQLKRAWTLELESSVAYYLGDLGQISKLLCLILVSLCEMGIIIPTLENYYEIRYCIPFIFSTGSGTNRFSNKYFQCDNGIIDGLEGKEHVKPQSLSFSLFLLFLNLIFVPVSPDSLLPFPCQ